MPGVGWFCVPVNTKLSEFPQPAEKNATRLSANSVRKPVLLGFFKIYNLRKFHPLRVSVRSDLWLPPIPPALVPPIYRNLQAAGPENRNPNPTPAFYIHVSPKIPIQPIHLLKTGLFLLLFTALSLADDSTSRLPIPEPKIFLNPDTVSLFVIRANPDDDAFRSLFNTAWESLAGPRGAGQNWIYRTILDKVRGEDSSALNSLLPAQFIRIDSMDEDDLEPMPTTATTVSGWPGLQALWYRAQGTGGDGKDYPTVELGDATLILRDGHDNPTTGRVLTKLDGTIASFPSAKLARYAVKRWVDEVKTSPDQEMESLLSSIDTNHHTYGVLFNKRGSVVNFLRWLHKGDVGKAEAAVGKERFERVTRQVESMTWEGDLLSDNELQLAIRFRTTSPQARQELNELLKDVRAVLDEYGRAGKMESTGLDNELHVDFRLVGHKGMLQRYIQDNF